MWHQQPNSHLWGATLCSCAGLVGLEQAVGQQLPAHLRSLDLHDRGGSRQQTPQQHLVQLFVIWRQHTTGLVSANTPWQAHDTRRRNLGQDVNMMRHAHVILRQLRVWQQHETV